MGHTGHRCYSTTSDEVLQLWMLDVLEHPALAVHTLRLPSALPTCEWGDTHKFVPCDDDDKRCRYCGGYPFDLLHWTI